MSFQVRATADFERSAKKIAKKHKSIYKDILKLITLLEVEPQHGTFLGNDLYKIRLNVTGLNRGKSGGARIITYVKIVASTVFLAEIYLKTDTDTVDESVIIAKLVADGLIEEIEKL